MEALSPMIRFEGALPTPVKLADWSKFSDYARMQHAPTGFVFQVSIDEAALAAGSAAVSDFHAYLVHRDAGMAMPDGEALRQLGRAAIVGFMIAHGVYPGGLIEGEDEVADNGEYDAVMGIFAAAMREVAAQGVSRSGLLPPLVDFVTAIGLLSGGEPGVEAMTMRMKRRIGDWKAGRFPTDDPSCNPPIPC
jgi:hypothetical protein